MKGSDPGRGGRSQGFSQKKKKEKHQRGGGLVDRQAAEKKLFLNLRDGRGRLRGAGQGQTSAAGQRRAGSGGGSRLARMEDHTALTSAGEVGFE